MKRCSCFHPFAGLLLAAALLTGCTGSESNSQRHIDSKVAAAVSGDALFQDVARTLNLLDRQVNLTLQPLKVVLDATKSRNKKPVLAVVIPSSESSTVADVLRVQTRNGQFRRVDVQPGDRIRYFALTDDYGKKDYVELIVARVIDDDTLLLAQGLNQPVLYPERIEIWRYSGENIKAIFDSLGRYRSARQGMVGWEPSPDASALQQIVDRLNQWLRSLQLDDQWQADPLIATLPAEYRAMAAREELAALAFAPSDGRLLQETVWLRDVSNWARGSALDDVKLAANLFDWTVRNIQLETRRSMHGLAHRPWQAMVYGRGTAEERAWVFTLLARQQGLNVAMLAIRDEDDPERLRPWVAALLSEGQLYLFDPQLGLPLPGVDHDAPATLADLLADESLLRGLDLDGRPYPVAADDLKRLVALVEGGPLSLSRRAMLVEDRLAAGEKMMLAARPTPLAETLQDIAGVAEVRLWDLPFRTLSEQLSLDQKQRERFAQQFMTFALRPRLWKARVMHFQGKFDLETTRRLFGEEMTKRYGDDFARLYYRQVRPADSLIEQVEHPVERQCMTTAKMHASYFLGLLTYDAGEYSVAADYFDTRTLRDYPDGPWVYGARYNLARCYEALGQHEQAIQLYEADDSSPQSHGNQLRARRLKTRE